MKLKGSLASWFRKMGRRFLEEEHTGNSSGSPIERVEDPERLFPGLYRRTVTLGHLDWRWGDLNANQMAFLCLLSGWVKGAIVEFGTFRGRTAWNLAQNVNPGGKIITIDLGQPADTDANRGKHAYGRYVPGEIFLSADRTIRARIEMIIGDSRELDLKRFEGTAGMVFVDGGHTYEVCKEDSLKALRLVRPGGVIVWDDYGEYWLGVKQALDELAKERELYFIPQYGFVVHIVAEHKREKRSK